MPKKGEEKWERHGAGSGVCQTGCCWLLLCRTGKTERETRNVFERNETRPFHLLAFTLPLFPPSIDSRQRNTQHTHTHTLYGQYKEMAEATQQVVTAIPFLFFSSSFLLKLFCFPLSILVSFYYIASSNSRPTRPPLLTHSTCYYQPIQFYWWYYIII